jgi:hypothetical protein
MLCPVCKAENSGDAVFCQKCGARIARKPPPIVAELADDSEEPEVRVKSRAGGPDDAGSEDIRPPLRRRRVIVEEDDGPRGGAIVPYRNPLALFAYYCVFLGLIVGIGTITAIAFYINAHGLNKADEISFCQTVVTIGFIVGMVLELAAFLLGVFGLFYVRSHRTARGTGHAIMGIVLGPILLLAQLAALILMIGWIKSSHLLH